MTEYIGEYVVCLTPKTFTDLRFHRREEIVRCRDCKYANDSCSVCYRGGETGDDLYYPEITSDGFCAWGERRGE